MLRMRARDGLCHLGGFSTDVGDLSRVMLSVCHLLMWCSTVPGLGLRVARGNRGLVGVSTLMGKAAKWRLTHRGCGWEGNDGREGA